MLFFIGKKQAGACFRKTLEWKLGTMIISIFNCIVFILSFGLIYGAKARLKQLSFRVMLGLILGIGYGFLLKLTPLDSLLEVIKNALTLIGNGYLALLRMVVVPLILTSILHAILNLGSGNEQQIKKMSFLTCAMLLGMTAMSSLIGLLIGQLFGLGQGLNLPSFNVIPKHNYTGMTDALLGLLPVNPIAAMATDNTIAVVLFAILLGMAARMLDENEQEKVKVCREFVSSMFTIVKKLTTFVMGLSPYGILSLMALLLLDHGTSLLSGMLSFIIAMYLAMIIVLLMHTVIVFSIGYHPWSYFKKAYIPLLVAFATRSSFGTLPITEETLRNKFNTSQAVSTFVPSIGATIGMNACAGIFPAMLVVMTLNIMHQPLTTQMIIAVMLINAISSLGISGIPGTAYIAATITLTSLNLPYSIVVLVQGIDPIIDMGRTTTNVNGVIATALFVDNNIAKRKT